MVRTSSVCGKCNRSTLLDSLGEGERERAVDGWLDLICMLIVDEKRFFRGGVRVRRVSDLGRRCPFVKL